MTKNTHSPMTDGPRGNLTWSSRLDMNSLAGGPALDAAHAAAGGENVRPRTSRIEKEIIGAVVILYAAIIACFAGLHLFALTQLD